MTLNEWISKLDNEDVDKLSRMEQLELKDMLIQLLGYKLKFGEITIKDIDSYKKGYKDGWNSCISDEADGWTVDYI